MKALSSGGGWQAIRYTLKTARKVGFARLWKAMRSKNACKTCALGMGGQIGGMRNEAGRFPEFCKKSLQAMASDMQGKIEERFFAEYSIEQMKGFSPREMEMLGRLTMPIYTGESDTHYRPISWDEALTKIADKLKATDPRETFFYSSGRSSNEAGFLLQLFARAYGTNHVNNCSYYCHQASGVGLADTLGTGTATVTLEDLDKADLVFLIGGNPASNHPRLMTSLMELRRRGGQVIVINPVRENGLVNFSVPSRMLSMLMGSPIASLYLQPKIGGDIALMAGITKKLIENHREDAAFIAASTDGFDAVRAMLKNLSWERIESESGVDKESIAAAASLYTASSRTIFGWTMGITHHEHGVQNVQWIVNLALLRGMVGKEGAGLMPIRGHSNVQGIGSIGVAPAVKKAVLDRLETLGVRPPAWAGYDTMSVIHAAHRGELRFGFCLGGNLFGANPDARYASEALGKFDLLVYLNTTLNTTHAHGLGRETIILPVLARDEESQSTTQESMFNYVRLSDGGPPRHAGCRAESAILADIAERVLGSGGPIDWTLAHNHDHLRQLIARIVPGFEQLADIGQTKREFQIPGRTFHTPAFNTPTGKAQFRAAALPDLPHLKPAELRIMSVRSEGQFNTVVYEEQDIYRGQERRDVILMNPLDIKRMGLKIDQRVRISNETGTMENMLVREFDIAEGCALMYAPEANAIIPTAVDPRSKTPAFKSVVAKIEAMVESTDGPDQFTPLRISGKSGDAMDKRRQTMKAC